MIQLLISSLLFLATPPATPATQPSVSPAATQPAAESTTQPATSPATNPQVDALLARMESAGERLQTIRCKVEYTVIDRLNLTETTRFGTILFKRAEPNPMFLIEFDKLIADDVVKRDKQWWLFRDRWLWEIKGKSRTIIKREILHPGEKADFFDIEKAPFPLPFGQQKEKILRNFDVTLVPPQVDDPPDTDHLVCRPKPDSPLADDYSRLDFYVSRKLDLPVKIVAEDVRGDRVSVARFPDLSATDLNVSLSDADFEQPAESRGFAVAEEPLKD